MGAESHGLLIELGVMLVGAGAIYGGIRADLKAIHSHLTRIEQAARKAHARLDRIACGRRTLDGCGEHDE